MPLRKSKTSTPRQPKPDVRLCALAGSDGGRLAAYTIERSPRLRNLRVVVSEGRICLKAPPRVPESRAIAFLQSHGEWILDTLETSRPSEADIEKHLARNPWVCAGGRKAKLSLGFHKGEPLWSWERGRKSLRMLYNPWAEQPQLAKALRQVAEEILPGRAHALAESVNERMTKASVRDQSSLWASCSGSRSLSLNWRLILLPPSLMDHIIYHELAHLKAMDHSPRFWKILESYDPKARERDRMISARHSGLMSLGRSRS